MRIIFGLIGILFDLLVLCLSGLAIYVAIYPVLFNTGVDYARILLSDAYFGRLQIAGVAAVFFLLSLRGVFLLMFQKKDKVFSIRSDEQGALSISMSTLEHLVSRLAAGLNPPSHLDRLQISRNNDGLVIKIKIRLDLSKCSLKDYSAELDKTIKDYFNNSLGLNVVGISIQAASRGAAQTSQITG